MLALEDFFQCVGTLEYEFFVSTAKLSDRCFCYFTAAMFVPLWGLQCSLNLGDTLLRITRIKSSRDLILGEVVYISIMSHIPDF